MRLSAERVMRSSPDAGITSSVLFIDEPTQAVTGHAGNCSTHKTGQIERLVEDTDHFSTLKVTIGGSVV